MQQIQAQIPNSLTVIRLIIGIVIILCAIIPEMATLPVVQLLAVIGVISDKLDGTLARFWKTESDLGKRLESIADPLFGASLVIYIWLQIGFPPYFFACAAVLLLIGTGGRLLVKYLTGKFFYEKSQITRVGVGMIFILVLWYLFNGPQKELFAWSVMAYSIFLTANYVRMMAVFVRTHRR